MDLVTVTITLVVLLGVVCLWDGFEALRNPYHRSLYDNFLLLGILSIIYLGGFLSAPESIGIIEKGVFLILGVLCLVGAVAFLRRSHTRV